MDRFARVVLGYHGVKAENDSFTKGLLTGDSKLSDWRFSQNNYDWLGSGIYFWEHSPERAKRWAGPGGFVIGALIQLGFCLDLLDIQNTALLAEAYKLVQREFTTRAIELPSNGGQDLKLRRLDCLVINSLVEENRDKIQTVRGAFEEGQQAYPGAGFKVETHIQIAVRDIDCILGVFLPALHEGG